MDFVFAEQVDIFDGTIIPFEIFDVIFLNRGCFFGNALVGVGDLAGKKPFPFGIGKVEIIELFKFLAQVNPTLTPFLRKATKKRYFSWLYTRNLLILLEAAFEKPNVVPHNVILCLTRSFYVV